MGFAPDAFEDVGGVAVVAALVVEGVEFERRAGQFEDGRIVGVGGVGVIFVAGGEGGEQQRQDRPEEGSAVFHEFVC